MRNLEFEIFREALTKNEVASVGSTEHKTYSIDTDTKEKHKLTRRDFTKELIALGIVATAGVAAYYNMPSSARFNSRSKNRALKYIIPQSGEEIQLISETDEPFFLAPLSYEWSVDSRIVSRSRNYTYKLSATRMYDIDKHEWIEGAPHIVRLVCRRGFSNNSAEQRIDVDNENLPQYSPQSLRGIRVKGLNFFLNRPFEGTPPSEDEMRESLAVTKYDLGCNGLRIFGGYEDQMLKCAEIAQELGFIVISLSPRYRKIDANTPMDIEDNIKRVISFSERAEGLRKTSKSDIVLIVGNELSIDVRGIFDGATYQERIEQMEKSWTTEKNKELNSYLNPLIDEVRKNFKGKITYAAGSWEQIDWQQPNIDIVGPNRRVFSEPSQKEWVRNLLENYKKYGKPVWVNEYGCPCWLNASRYEPYAGQPYTQEEQANNMIESLDFFQMVGGIDAAFAFVFGFKLENESLPENRENTYGIMNYKGDNSWEKKLGAYALASFKVN